MKLQSTQISLISAYTARTASLVDEDLLDSPPTTRDTFLATLRAAVIAPPLEGECHIPVDQASHDRPLDSILSCLASRVGVLRRGGAQTVPPEPNAHRRGRPPDLTGDLSDRHAGIDQHL
jgi:hypothetical protein